MDQLSVSKTLLASAIAIATLTGCSDSNKSGGASAAETTTLSGTAAKGIIKSGLVTLFSVDSNGVRDAVLGQANTDANGAYSVDYSGYSGPVLVRVSARDDGTTRMVCDISGTESCGTGINFGDDVALGSDFDLTAVAIPADASSEVSVNVTAVTHLAARLAEAQGITETSVNDSNSQVADLFGIVGDITQLPVVDLTDSEALSNFEADDETARNAALKLNLLSAALLGAAKNDGADLDTAMSTLADNFVANNGQLVQRQSNGTTTTTLQEILQEANRIITENLSDIDVVAAVDTELDADLNQADLAEDGGLTDAEPSDEVISDGFLAARAFVNDLRELVAVATLNELASGSTAFADQLALARTAIGDEADYLFKALVEVSAALAEAVASDVVSGEFQANNGLTVSVSVVDSESVYRYAGDVVIADVMAMHTVAVDLSATGSASIESTDTISETESGWVESGTGAGAAELQISGELATSTAQLMLAEGSAVTITGATASHTDTYGSDGSSELSSEKAIASMALDLDVTLSQLRAQIPVAFEGSMGLSLAGYDSEEAHTHSVVECGMAWCPSSEFAAATTFDSLSLSLAGNFMRSDEVLAAALTLNVDNQDYVATETDIWTSVWNDITGYVDYTGSYTQSDESESAWVGFSFVLDLDATFAGVSDTVDIRLSGNRNSYTTGAASIRFQFDGKTLLATISEDTSAEAGARQITVTNSRGATLSLTPGGTDSAGVVGTITAAGEQQAQVSFENDIYVIRYNTGFVESL